MVPPKNMPITIGATLKKATMPVCTVLPVVSSTNQGMAMAAIASPVTEISEVIYRA